MINPARDILNYIDEHKHELKDNVYKTILDKLTPIHKEFKEKRKTKYEVYFLISSIHSNNNDDDIDEITEITHRMKSVQVFLSDVEVEILNKQLNKFGAIHWWDKDDIKKYNGLHTLHQFKQIFTKHFEFCNVEISDEHEETKAGKLLFNNIVCLTRIIKIE